MARRKLIPSLYRLITENGIADRCVLLGVAPSDLDDDAYRTWTREALTDSGLDDVDLEAWCDENIHYQQLGREAGTYDDVRHRIEAIEADHDLPGNRAFYLALPPWVFPAAITGLGEAALNESPGWTRLVIEKPIGTDLESACALNGVTHEFFDESQVYRIDHYLGKETVQNLLSFRFSNPMFESVWNRDRVESVEITVAEDLGIGSRANYYETAGALRDMVQNHLTQIAVTFQQPPLCIFHGHRDACVVHPNVLLITLQPDEGFMVQFNVKVPGEAMMLDTQELSFSYDDVYGRLPDAYQTLILDVIEGDQTLFVRADEVEASWRLYDPLLDYRPEPHRYEAGTWGPEEMDPRLVLSGRAWTGS